MRTTMTRVIAVGVLALMVGGSPAWAHHAMFAQFDITKTVTIKGTLTKLEWVNPHGWIYMDVKRADGRVENWAIETGSPLRMGKRGLKPTDFRPGKEIVVAGFPAKDRRQAMAGWVITFLDRDAEGEESSFALGR
jgi:Family of unknown function (DUF6152)